MGPTEAEELIQRDRAEADSMGQQLEKTLRLADFFVRYAHNNTSALKLPLERFASLIHGDNGLTPTSHEVGMYAAFSASLKSACLSRQVGAAITDDEGNVLSTGCNDVPRSGGGLYEAGRSTDHRCVFLEGGVCFNHRHKDRLRDEIAGILEYQGGIAKNEARRVADIIREKTGLRDLIEFSRSVHAEMDAIVRIARTGGQKISGATLFTTTYPCHNCARHIVASGIKAVYFIEPYEKSLAKDLHSDSIAHEIDSPASSSTGDSSRVAFLHFEGVAPNRFATLFNQTGERKDSAGLAVKRSPLESSKKAPEYLDNYRQLEAQVIRHLQEINALEALPKAVAESDTAEPPRSA
jgi:deoxycytidylate deaminase